MATTKAPDDWAAAVADGEAVDWTALAAGAATPRERRQIERFALLARIAGVHADTARHDGDDDAGRLTPEYRAGDTWGSLRIVGRLAAGTFGTVYRAHDPALSRDVALKILHLPAHTPVLASEALREGRLLARVRHPNVVAVYGADCHDGRVGLWMELIEGRTLEEDLETRGPLPEHEVAAIGHDLAQALDAVHGAGLVHRDVKAQNVMRAARDGRIVLMDLSAGGEQRDAAIPQRDWPATLAGSPLYLAPELLDGAPASFQSDAYSLGVVLYRLLTANYPVRGATLDDVMRAHRRGAITALGDARPGVASTLRAAVSRATAADPRRRPTARDLAETLGGLREAPRARPRRALPALAVTCLVTTVPLAYLALVRPASVLVSRPAPPLTVTSVSPQAVRLYREAAEEVLVVNEWLAADARPQLDGADGKLVRALALDARFAAALSLRARVRELRDVGPNAAVPLAEQALAHTSDLPVAERSAIEAYAHRLRADLGANRRDQLVAAATAYEDVLKQAPADYWALTELSRLYPRLQQQADAERVATQGALHHPHALRLAADAALVYLRRRDRSALRRVATGALAHARPEHHRAPSTASLALADLVGWEAKDFWMDGDPARALSVLQRASRTYADSPNFMVLFQLASAFESLGRFDDARAVAGRIDNDRFREYKLALIDARQERWDQLRTRLNPGTSGPEQLARYNFMYIFAGWLDDAERLLAQQTSGGPRMAWRMRQEFEAQLRTAQGRSAEALALFAPLLVDETDPQLRMRETVALARLQAGDVQGARTVLERIYREPAMAVVRGLSAYDWLRCVILLAEIDRDAGRLEDARRVAATARRLLEVADADNPVAARLARLP